MKIHRNLNDAEQSVNASPKAETHVNKVEKTVVPAPAPRQETHGKEKKGSRKKKK